MSSTTATSVDTLPPSPDDSAPGLLVSLSPLSAEALVAALANLALAFPDRPIAIATPDPAPATLPAYGRLRLIPYTPAAPEPGRWMLTPADFLNACRLMQEHKAAACLLLGPEAQSLAPQTLRSLAHASLGGADLATPRYSLGPRDGLVNSAILYPATRALFGARARFPLAIDLAFSMRMAQRLAAAAERSIALGQDTAILWPIAEAAAAGFSLTEVPAGPRALPPADADTLSSRLAQVAGSFFADIDAKASYWQRARLAYPTRASAPNPAAGNPANHPQTAAADDQQAADLQSMIDSFSLAYNNLHEIWSLVLTPNSLLGLKKLSLMPPASFLVNDTLWARIVYDFILAYRLRTINRGHLLGALTPLYLAWVASHLLLTGSGNGPSPERTLSADGHIEALAAAFESDKPYLVSRWRWPDRFNP